MDKKACILVTGSHGFVGQNLLLHLAAEGYERVIGFSRAACDLTDRGATLAMFRALQPKYVFHLAAFVRGILGNIENQAESYLQNTLINTHVVDAAMRCGSVQKIVAMGTVAMYGVTGAGPPIKPEEYVLYGLPHHTEFGYASAKRAMLVHLLMSRLKFSMPLSTNMYGPYDHFDGEHGHVIPMMIRKFYEGNPVLWGDGRQTRDFLHVSDACRALVTIMDKIEGPVNMATGISDTLKTISDILWAHTGCKPQWDTSKPTGQKKRSYDVSKLKAAGFGPTVRPEYGIVNTYDWFAASRSKSVPQKAAGENLVSATV